MHLVRIRFSDIRNACMVLAVKCSALRNGPVHIFKQFKWVPVSPHLGHVVHNDVEVLFVNQVINCKSTHPVLNRDV